MKTLNPIQLNPYYPLTVGIRSNHPYEPHKHVITSSSRSDNFMSRLFDLIESRIDDSTLSINKVASALHVSKMQLYRRVKRSSKLSPNQFIRAIRLQKGRQLLLTTDWNIAEIAYAVGFNDPNYFSRSFTREFKRSPSRYRSEEFKTNSTPV